MYHSLVCYIYKLGVQTDYNLQLLSLYHAYILCIGLMLTIPTLFILKHYFYLLVCLILLMQNLNNQYRKS